MVWLGLGLGLGLVLGQRVKLRVRVGGRVSPLGCINFSVEASTRTAKHRQGQG